MDFEETVRFLERSALFSDVTPEQIRAVAACAVVENHPAGSIIIEEDAPSDYFYLIVDGAVDIYREEKAFAAGKSFNRRGVRAPFDHREQATIGNG